MAFAINQNFDLKSKRKDFVRQELSLDQLKTTRDSDYADDYQVTIGGKIYIFHSSNSADPTLGKWREFKSGEVLTAGRGLTKSGTTLSVNLGARGGLQNDASGAIEIKVGTALQIGGEGTLDVSLGTGLGINDRGKLGVKLGTGLTVGDENTIVTEPIPAGPGLEWNAAKSALNLKTGLGLTASIDEGVSVRVGSGLTATKDGGVELKVGSGLSATQTGGVELKVGTGLNANKADGVSVRIGAGLATTEGGSICVGVGTGLKLVDGLVEADLDKLAELLAPRMMFNDDQVTVK